MGGSSSPTRNKVMCDVGDEEDTANGFYRRAGACCSACATLTTPAHPLASALLPCAGDTRAQFLEHGAALLRFEAEWIELGAPFTDRRRFALQVRRLSCLALV